MLKSSSVKKQFLRTTYHFQKEIKIKTTTIPDKTEDGYYFLIGCNPNPSAKGFPSTVVTICI